MAQETLNHRLLRRREGFQLSYITPQTIFASRVYPRTSNNGSTIIVYGHEQGLTILWYGGRNFKKDASDVEDKAINIDLTDDIDESTVEFEEEDEVTVLDQPVRQIIKRLDVPFNISANRISILEPPAERTSAERPGFFDSHVVIAAACLDQTLRVVTIPLEPQRDLLMATQVIRIATASAHQDLISDVAITLTAESTEEDDLETHLRSRSRNRAADTEHEFSQQSRKWSLLIASTSPTGSGLLLIHQIPFVIDGFSMDPEEHVPVHRRFLRASLISCRISFNPCAFPAERHSHLLLSIPDSPSVQVYNTIPRVESAKRRQGSGNTASSGPKSLITLLPGFASSQNVGVLPARKRILDAKWIMQGRAIVALLEDGEWGIWDLEAVGPTPASKSSNLVRGQSSSVGIQGGALTKFAVRGVLKNATQPAKTSSSVKKASSTSGLAPMTPHTRKARSKGLFKGQQQDEAGTLQNDSQINGVISLATHNLATGGALQHPDEALIFSYGSTNTLIPSIQAYWRSETGGKAGLDTMAGGRPIVLPILQTATEEHVATHLLPGIAKSATMTSTVPAFMVSTMSRLVLLIPSANIGSGLKHGSSSLALRPMSAKAESFDQALLESGELDIDGMDRILDNMAQSSADHSMVLDGNDKRSFVSRLSYNDDEAGDEDEDVDMSTPTVSRSARSKLTVNQEDSARRRLFA